MADDREADFLRELYEDWSSRMAANPAMSIADLRSMFNEWGKPAREPEGRKLQMGIEVGGVPGIWAFPQDANSARVILYTHGGGFAVGSADSHRKLAGHLASALGVTAFIPDYRRSPRISVPAIEDGIAAYLGLIERGFHPGFITTAGDGAGGNLAIAIAFRLRELGRQLPGSIIAFSPWLDMALRGATLEANAATDALVGRQILEGVVSMFLGGTADPLDPLANPLNDFQGFPPLYINAGGAEALLSDAESLSEKARNAGVSVTLSVVPGMQHVFPALPGARMRRTTNCSGSQRGIAHFDRRKNASCNNGLRGNPALEVNMIRNVTATKTPGADFDAIVIGGGFGGLYAVHKLRNDQGLHVKAYDNASDVGGTWYWNRYPGALSDTEASAIASQLDKELLDQGSWQTRYLTQPEILEYLNNVADRFDLRSSYQFNTKISIDPFRRSDWAMACSNGQG